MVPMVTLSCIAVPRQLLALTLHQHVAQISTHPRSLERTIAPRWLLGVLSNYGLTILQRLKAALELFAVLARYVYSSSGQCAGKHHQTVATAQHP